MAQVITERITRTPGICGGKACIAGSRIRVMDIMIWYEHQGMTPDEIVFQFPGLTLSDVHIALAYYYDHLEEIRDDIRRNDEVAEQFRAQYPSKVKDLSRA
ncbi:MAG: DUF433 domain-containing protein [Acidobacteria bacterium]|nr:DUF433 domain-containing protein [Acidobacteriota bacterium]